MKKLLLIIIGALLLPLLVFCTEQTVSPLKLATPTLTVNEQTGDVSWNAIEGASGYRYKIGDAEKDVSSVDVLAIRLISGESVSVKALGDGEKYLDSDWSEAASFKTTVKLPKPKLSITKIGNQVLVSWEKDVNATSYMYRLNSGAETPIEGTQYLINAGDTFRLRAVGDGEAFLSSDWTVIEPE